MKRQIEIFTANCPICEPVVNMVHEQACDACEVTTYNIVKQSNDQNCLEKLHAYGINKIPAVAMDGQLLDCCRDRTITRDDLIEAGIGKGG